MSRLLEIGVARVNVLGVGVHCITVDRLLAEIEYAIGNSRRLRLLYANAFGLNLAYDDLDLRGYYNSADYVMCDGFGVKWAARLLGQNLPARFTPPDWLPRLADLAERRGYTFYFLGNRPGVAERAARVLQTSFPHVSVVGVHHGYFDKRASSGENEVVLAAINKCRPNILFVGFGIPLQERWLQENWARLNADVVVAVGAMLDFVAGETSRGPRWMTDHGLEWLSRLVTEPRRLWRRYIFGIPLFLSRVARQRLGLLHFDDDW